MRSLKLLVAIAALCLLGGPALAQATLTLTVPTGPQPVATNFDVTAAYVLNAGTYDGLELELSLPANVTLDNTAYESQTFSTVSCSSNNPTAARTCKLSKSTLAVGGTGISGNVTFKLRLDRYQWRDGAPVALSAKLTAAKYNNGSALSVGPISPPSFTAKTVWDLRWTTNRGNLAGGQFAYFRNHPSADPSQTGLLYTFAYGLNNSYATAQVASGAAITVTLPAGVTFVKAYQSGNMTTEGTNAAFTITAPQPWTAAANATVTYTALNPIGVRVSETSDSYHAASWYLMVEVWVPCSSIPNGIGRDIIVSATAKELDHLDAEVPHTSLSSETLSPPAAATSGGACGTGGAFTKGFITDSGRAEGTTVSWKLVLQPEKGTMPYTGVLVQDRLPNGLELSASVTPTVTPADFTFYSCALPTQQTKLTLAAFLGHLGAACSAGVRADATHVVIYAPTWGSGTGINDLEATFGTFVPPDFVPSGASYPYNLTNTADVDAVDPSSAAYTATATAIRALTDQSYLIVKGAPTTTTYLPIGTSYKVTAALVRQGWYASGVQAGLDITVPAGVTVTAVRDAFTDTNCGVIPAVYTKPVIGTNPLHWSFGDVQHPDFDNCAAVELDIIVSRTANYKHGDPITFVVTPTATNTTSALSASKAFTYTLTAPAEMRVALEPGCHDGTQPSLFMIASNTGGRNLGNVVSRIAIPGDMTFAGLGAVPSGATVYYDLGSGNLTSTPPTDLATVKAIELRVPALSAGADPVQLEVKLSASGSGTWYAAATMSATELGATTAELLQDTGVCPAEVSLIKFFDADRDGEKSNEEVQLPRWQFAVRDADNTLVRTVTTYQSGAVVTRLNPGAYTVTETLPTDTQGTWSPTTGGVTQSVTTSQSGTNALVFGNNCDCPDDGDGNACTLLACQSSGSCTRVFAEAGTTCNDKTACTTADTCNASGVCAGAAITCNDDNTCTTDTCNATTGCVFTNQTGTSCVLDACTVDATCTDGICGGGTPKSFDDDNACTIDSCDATTGAISHVDQSPIECVAGGQVIWGSMWLNSALKAFRCVVSTTGATPVCEVDNNGVLVAYPPVCE